MFMILGPNGPFTNIPPTIETQVQWISDLVKVAQQAGATAIEATRAAEDDWTVTCEEIANMTLFSKAESWIFGANIPGKTNAVMFYLGGLGNYRQKLDEVKNNNYAGFVLQNARQT
jgi:cyclohexanone monooxygenase